VSGLIFCNRKRDVSALAKALKKQNRSVGELHGDMAQASRMETLNAFRNDEIELLVCSDVAARGLDIPQVSHVFNYDVPNSPEDYIHRIGRTGRAGRSGIAYMLATPADSKSLAAIEKLIGGAIPPVDVDSVRILPPEKVEGEVIAEVALDKLKIAAEDETTESGGESSGKRRRRGARRGKKSDTPANANVAPESGVASEVSQPEPQQPEPQQPEVQELAPQETEAVQPVAEPEIAAASAQDNEPAQADAKQASDRQKAANDHGGRGKPQSRKSDNSRERNNDRDKNMTPEKRQAPNGYQSKPFGDHTPAFMLRRVPVSASA
jgi:superfamily II DNA/RNA helicase